MLLGLGRRNKSIYNMGVRSFGRFLEQVGRFPHFLICRVLGWIMRIVLLFDGFLACLAKYFGMEMPCWLCSRMNHVLAHKTVDFHYNKSICEAHRKEVSSLAFCHNHKKISEISNMCERCLLSFAIGKECNRDTNKSLLGTTLNKDLECFVGNGQHIQLSLKDDEVKKVEKNTTQKCSCCRASIKIKPTFSKGKNSGSLSKTPMTSKNDESPQNQDSNNAKSQIRNIKLKEEANESSPLLTEAEDLNNESSKVPTFLKNNRFYPLADSPCPHNTPKAWMNKKTSLGKTELASTSNEEYIQNEGDAATLYNSKKDNSLDGKSLMALYVELDEERTASAVAANNAMAMITRLQEEKAALQMDALQYQRMMEEQVEYEEEALEETNDMVLKLKEDVKTLEAELAIYRDKFGYLLEDDFQEFNLLAHDGEDNVEKDLNLHQAVPSQADINEGGRLNESLKDFRPEKTYLLGPMKKMEDGTPLAESSIQDTCNVSN